MRIGRDGCISEVLAISWVSFSVGELIFRHTHKIMKRNYWVLRVCVCESVCLPLWNNLALTGQIFMKYDIWVFFETVEKIQVCLKSDKTSG